MIYKEIYTKLYHDLDKQTPLGFDCGRLCGRACCQVTPDLPGMYLYPGEEELFLSNAGYNTLSATLGGYGSVTLLSCNGNCKRSERPLACRVFPLAPKIDNGMVSVRMDPRGRPVCPLCHQPKSSLSVGFIKCVETVFTELLAEPSMLAYLSALSLSLDEYEKPIL